ncbi:DUF2177 family protein [Rhizorhabdus sp.]|uniref:DUF2177 family protein n=1 Tax=Rhizorhabdus sp. TaxID=1968843 RepID=UPI0019BDC748|nr:DUF2177 family protein [Rhizorhabdus sp.]MBD3761276.1 DUF2177 family protein [Rhizorhabdus sp.]
MARIIIAYISTLLVFFAVDAVWLTNSADLLYRPILGPILAPEFRLAPAIIFYLLYIAGLLYFGVLPGLRDGLWRTALIKGGLFGFFAYATYDLTNQATLIIWSTKITIADMIWGSFVSGFSAAGGCLITGKLRKAAA